MMKNIVSGAVIARNKCITIVETAKESRRKRHRRRVGSAIDEAKGSLYD